MAGVWSELKESSPAIKTGCPFWPLFCLWIHQPACSRSRFNLATAVLLSDGARSRASRKTSCHAIWALCGSPLPARRCLRRMDPLLCICEREQGRKTRRNYARAPSPSSPMVCSPFILSNLSVIFLNVDVILSHGDAMLRAPS